MLRRLALIMACAALSGCGAAYISTKVREGESAGANVQVAPITVDSISTANSQSYTPRDLPAAFREGAGGGSGLYGAGAVPEPAFSKETRPVAMETRLPPDIPETPYQIGIGDVLLLATKTVSTTVEELSGLLAAQNRRQGYIVQDDGAIAIPDVGRIKVEGLTLEEAEAAVFSGLVGAQFEPAFSLEIAEFNSKRISVGGAVKEATVVPVRLGPVYLEEALAAAGGISSADIDYTLVRIYRGGSLYQVPLSEVYSSKSLQRLRLVAGDSIFVDDEYNLEIAQAYFAEQIQLGEYRLESRVKSLEALSTEITMRRQALDEERNNFRLREGLDAEDRDYVYITGEVKKQKRFPLPFGRQATLADAMYDADGISIQTGNPAQVYILRGSADPAQADQIVAWHLDARNAASLLLATRFELRPSDVIFVAEQPITRWNRVIQQFVPSLLGTAVAATR